MPRNFGLDRHRGAPAFDLASWSYCLDFALVPITVTTWLLMGPALSLLSMGIGLAVWTLAEYWIHRLVFHGPTRFEPMHHALP